MQRVSKEVVVIFFIEVGIYGKGLIFLVQVDYLDLNFILIKLIVFLFFLIFLKIKNKEILFWDFNEKKF